MNNRPAVDPAAILFKGVGTWSAIAVAVAGMAPTMAMNLNPQEPAEHVGRVVPLVFASPPWWCCWWPGVSRAWRMSIPMPAPPMGSSRRFSVPVRAWIAGWTLFGTYLCFAVVGLAAVGLFGANLLQRLDLWRDASSMVLTVLAAVVVAPLSIVPARRAGLVLIVLEGIAVAAMVLMAGAVLLLVAQGHGPQGDPPLRDLFVPTQALGAAAIALGLSFGLLSFAGFEQVATLGEEVEKSRFTIPRVLIGTVLGAGVVFTLVTAAETLGFGTDRAGVARFTTSTSLLADLSARYFGGWSGDLFDGLAICSAWAARWRRSWRRRAFCWLAGMFPSSPMARILASQRDAPRRRRLCSSSRRSSDT
jgi:amino acid transporter